MAEKKKKKTAQGFTAKDYTPGLRKKGESFMDFTTRQHEQRYPGAQRMAREAGAGGWRAFTPAGAEYRRGIREEMPWLNQGQRYQSADWQRMLANRQSGMYGGDKGTAAQVGGAPPGTRPAPTVGPNYNVLGGGQRPAIAPLQRKTAYMADPRNQAAAAAAQRANIRQTGGDASLAEARTNMLRHDFPAVVPPRFSRSYQEDMGTGRFAPTQQGAHRRLPFNSMTGQMGNFGRNNILYPGMQREGTPMTAPTGPTQLQQPQRMSYPGQNYGATGAYLGQFPRYPASPAGSQLPYNVLDQQRRRNLAGYPMNQETTSSMIDSSPWYWGPPRRPRVVGEQYPRRRPPPWT